MADSDMNLGSKVASLDARMFGLENTVKGIGESILTLGNKIDRRAETPWGSIWAACGFAMTVLTVVGAMALNPVKDSVSTIASQLSDTNKSAAAMNSSFMPKEDIREGFKAAALAMTDTNKAMAQAFKDERALADQSNRDLAASFDRALSSAAARRDDYQKMADARSERNSGRIEKLQDLMVPRGEMEEHWREVSGELGDKQRQLTELKEQMAAIYGARDIIRDMNDRLHATQERVWSKEGPR